MCHVSHVTKKLFFWGGKVVELVGRASVINGATPSSFPSATQFWSTLLYFAECEVYRVQLTAYNLCRVQFTVYNVRV